MILLGHGAGQHDAGPLEEGLDEAGAIHPCGGGAAGTVGGAVELTQGPLQGDLLGAAVPLGAAAIEAGAAEAERDRRSPRRNLPIPE